MSLESGEKEIILGFVFKDSTNLELALKIHEVYDDVRKKININFVERLENKLQHFLSEDTWIIHNELKENLDSAYKGVYIEKEHWAWTYSIGIESQGSKARNFIIGIWKNENLEPINNGELKELIDQKHIFGGSSNYWEWYHYLDSKYRWWDSSQTLILMHDTSEVEDAIIQELLKLKALSEKVIDKALEKSS